MVHHPYESFASSVEEFIAQAADDPKVQSIKMTLYRAGGDSPIARSLMRAAERGVQVAVLVELKARFDEATNVGWAKALERAGVHVVYGLVGLKTHAKTVLVVRNDDDGLRRYCHIGTGNYNSKTARLYEDVGFVSCDPDVGNDVTQLFNHLTGYSRSHEYSNLLVAPRQMRNQLRDLIEHEASFGTAGRMMVKLNSLQDPELIESLYAASDAGVSIDLIIRGICCLRPAVRGVSDNIEVHAIVDRYLEHARVFHFQNGGRDEVYIGSADWMPRNFHRRVETVLPIEDEKHKARLTELLQVQWSDTVKAWSLKADGSYARVSTPISLTVTPPASASGTTTNGAPSAATAPVRSQARFIEMARDRVKAADSMPRNSSRFHMVPLLPTIPAQIEGTRPIRRRREPPKKG